MPREARRKSKSGVYHVMLRGANRQEIFHDDEDRMKFLDILKKYKRIAKFTMYAWCLMGNHVHLLLREGDEELATTMKRIGVSYATFYNWKYATTGHLFQDRFKSENVETEEYFLTVVRYIHQNPVKAGICPRVEDWQWSSCAGYYGEKYFPGGLLDRNIVLNMFGENRTFAVERFKDFNERSNHDECLEDTYRRRKLTDEQARQEIKQLLGVIGIAQVKSLPGWQRDHYLMQVKTIEGITLRQAARILGVSKDLVHRAGGV
ncbi:REP-associated tyrosine transposase [Mesobacillus jeotgali]|uniref:REP-associated tyrosine transposase n=1 Tax=Mesobacillus jeotgali TaxID=129985 RepID=UPI000C850886|nr:transposase [Mesobacillus jeotgali]